MQSWLMWKRCGKKNNKSETWVTLGADEQVAEDEEEDGRVSEEEVTAKMDKLKRVSTFQRDPRHILAPEASPAAAAANQCFTQDF